MFEARLGRGPLQIFVAKLSPSILMVRSVLFLLVEMLPITPITPITARNDQPPSGGLSP
jgi:hypothetical protein